MQQVGDLIAIQKVIVSDNIQPQLPLENLLNDVGLHGKSSLHNDSAGEGMWLARCESDEKVQLIFDLGGTYPIGEMHVWNYNQFHPMYANLTARGLKEVSISYSLDNNHWTELEKSPFQLAKAIGKSELAATNLDDGSHSPIHFDNALARYVQLSFIPLPGKGNWGGYNGEEPYFGLSKVRFFAGEGLAAVPSDEWSAMFHRTEGWSGSDGIYSISIDEREIYDDSPNNKTIFLFGDTFIGSVDQATNQRLESTMINNSIGVLQGNEPLNDSIQFLWNNREEVSKSFFVPKTDEGKTIDGAYYWLQDGIAIDGTFYCMPMIIGPNPDGPEGFEFEVYGVTCVSVPIRDDGFILEQEQQIDTPLFFEANNGKRTYFGAGFMAQTGETGLPNVDGYIYVYGLQNWEKVKLVVARVKPEFFTDYSEWEFWNGDNWTTNMKEVVPIANEVSSELSVSLMTDGPLAGKYVVTFQESGTGNWLSLYVGESPVGPFVNPTRLYYCDESERGNGIYTYNAKAHPHLSKPGELLVSYNVNTTSWDMHKQDGSIYRPKFVSIKPLY